MMQELMVYAIVACAAWVVLQRYGPAPVRSLLTDARGKIARRLGMAGKVAGSGQCGGCAGCASNSSARAQTVSTIKLEQLRKTSRRQ